jgi:hypothetical protein
MMSYRLFALILATLSLIGSGCSLIKPSINPPVEKPKSPPQEILSKALVSEAHAAQVPAGRTESLTVHRSWQHMPVPTLQADPLPDTLQFTQLKIHNSLLVGLLAHLVLWALYRSYHRVQQRRHGSLSQNDLAVVKIIRDNATAIYDKNAKPSNVIRMIDH